MHFRFLLLNRENPFELYASSGSFSNFGLASICKEITALSVYVHKRLVEFLMRNKWRKNSFYCIILFPNYTHMLPFSIIKWNISSCAESKCYIQLVERLSVWWCGIIFKAKSRQILSDETKVYELAIFISMLISI